MAHIPTAWKIETVYKGVNIYNDDGNICIVYSFGETMPSIKHCKTISSAKRWITSNKTYHKSSVVVAGRCNIDLRGDTKFY